MESSVKTEPRASISYYCFRRLIDLIFSLIAFLLLLIILPIIWIINLFTESGPIFYWQERVGLNGHVFKMLKLRTMRIDAEKDGPKWTQIDDNRITELGIFLRRSHLDELPQCYNILIGEMSVIGPRPERPVFTKKFEREFPLYHKRYLVKPGITGLAQINQMYSANLNETKDKLQFDLMYLERQNIWMDINILAHTVLLIIGLKGR